MNAHKLLLSACILFLLLSVSCGEQEETGTSTTTTNTGGDPPRSPDRSANAASTASGNPGSGSSQSAVKMPEGGVGVASNGKLRVVPAEFKLGNIEPGSSHPRMFLIENISADPVTITRAVTSCKCTTTTSVANRVLAPGESIDFEVTLDAPRTPGVKEAKVQLLMEGGLRLVQLVLEGDVTMAVKASPPYVGGPKGGQSTGVIGLKAIDGRPFSVLSAGGIVPSGEGDPAEQARSEHTLSWDLADGPDLSSHLWWVVYTDHPDCPVLPLRIRNPMTGSKADVGRFERYWIFDENVVNAGRIKAGQPVKLDVVISHYNPQGRGAVVNPRWRNVKMVRSLSPEATSRMVAVTPISQDEIRIEFEFTPEVGFSGPLYAFVEVETDSGVGRFAVLALVD
ncbi:MAG: DUF1573 domain-containing protein [Phycisphaerales bacterium]|jgi:hypothetical protein|nr:DUF1573 domain-containing protein [Phycisphaerales bacterium]